MNPWVQPVPIKIEPGALDNSVPAEDSTKEQTEHEITMPSETEDSDRQSPIASTSYRKTLTNLFSPKATSSPKSKAQKKKTIPPSSKIFTRRKALDAGVEMPSLREHFDKHDKKTKK